MEKDTLWDKRSVAADEYGCTSVTAAENLGANNRLSIIKKLTIYLLISAYDSAKAIH